MLQGGCEAYLSKPISVARFFETIDRSLVQSRGYLTPLEAFAKARPFRLFFPVNRC